MCKLQGMKVLIWDWLRRKAWVLKTSTLRSLISAIAATCDLQHMLCFIPKGKILLLQIQEQNAFLTGTFPLIPASFLQWYTHNSSSRKTDCTNGSVNAHTHMPGSFHFLPVSDFWCFIRLLNFLGRLNGSILANSTEESCFLVFSRAEIKYKYNHYRLSPVLQMQKDLNLLLSGWNL